MVSKNIDISLKHISYTREICLKYSKESITAIELLFVYQLFQSILVEFSLIFPQWNIDLARGITSVWNNFAAESIDLEAYNEKDSFLYSFLKNSINIQKYPKNTTYVFDIFWPNEILQAIIVSDIIKRLSPNSTFILNTENANEQFDFPEYMENFTREYSDLLKHIDFITCHKWSLHQLLNYRDLQNIFCNNQEYFSYNRGKTLSQDIRENFLENLSRTEKKYEFIFGLKYVEIRLYPYKCYHSACFFCTINNGNENIFPHQRISDAKEYVDIVLDFIVRNKIQYVNFFDEAIHPEILEYLIDEIFKKNMHFIYRFRARYLQHFLQKDFLKKLYQSWARYVWVGLESASPRINNMVNKSNSDLDLSEKFQVIKNFNEAWIPFHNYSIFWFPQETKQESFYTFKFLCNSIEKTDHFTCTPNLYGLMRGSFMYKHPERFWMNIISDSADIVWDFLVYGKKRDYTFLQWIISKVNEYQFTKYFPYIDSNHFWDFIDRSAIFYHFKVQYRKNPYKYHIEKNQYDIENHFPKLLSSHIPITKFYRIEYFWSKSQILSLITYKYYNLQDKDIEFLKNYDTTMSLGDNMKCYKVNPDFVCFLLKNFIISNHGEDAWFIHNKTV